ncbi:hypothetical protein GCM10023321_21280 [Pseudonocardia eucalypti]|uniref:Condensation domain-containing protein n=1 Tax=Pseudonocardia eucalypti TaxID=648755 RepID=A0ABP9PUU2_9PSEU|nr:hypothetical protein [Pseudonocardia eucalypti]
MRVSGPGGSAGRRAALMSKRLMAAGVAEDRPPEREIVPRPDRDRAPLSPAQHATWAAHRADVTGAAYNVCIHLAIEGELDVPALRAALLSLVARHEVLRTRYPLDRDGRPYQRIDPAPEDAERLTPLVDLPGGGSAERLISELAGHRFDLAEEWPLRAVIFRDAGEGAYGLVLAVHHIVWDGGCWPVISAELSLGYALATGASDRAPEPLTLQYGDVAAARASAPARPADQEYWRRQLAGLPGPLPLPADEAASAEPGVGGRRSILLDAAETRSVTTLAGERRVTVFAVVLAAFGALLYRHCGRVDLPIGSAAMNRDGAALRALVGNFGNTLVLRLDCSGDPSFVELVDRADRVSGDGLDHQDMPYRDVVAQQRPDGDPFNVRLLYLAQGMAGPVFPGLRTSWRNIHNGTYQHDLAVEIFLVDGQMRVEATYAARLFSPARVDELLADFRRLLAKVTEEPQMRLSGLSERHTLSRRGVAIY